MGSASTATLLQFGPVDLPDLTKTLLQSSKRLAGTGSFGTVYSCLCAQNGEVAVKAIAFDRSVAQAHRDEFLRKMKRELGIWKRLDHPNIVPLLGTAQGGDFGSDHPCMVSMWMPHGTLAEYIRERENELSLASRIRLIAGSAAGLEYLHSKSVVHGDFHPGNIMIDSNLNPCLTDFGLSQTLDPQNDLSYLWTESVRPGAAMWVAPELLYPDLFPDVVVETQAEATLRSDIYSLGSIILFILSGKPPWSRTDFEKKSDELQNPPRPLWPIIPDIVWDFIERCWSPRIPKNRPLAQEVLSFARDRLQQLLQPNPTSDINVVLFGALGCGKSSIINLLAEEPVAPVSADMEPCTKQPQCYRIFIGERRFQLWDTMGFRLSCGRDISPLSPYEQAHAVLRNISDGVHLILLCARKDEISSSLGGLYWLIHDFFFGGRAPVAFVVTHFDAPDERWRERNQRFITTRAGIPIQSIPLAYTTTVQIGCDQSRQMLKGLLENYASTTTPIPLRLNLSSHEAASLDIATHCELSSREATSLVEKFSSPTSVINVVLFGAVGCGKSSIVNLLAGEAIAQVSADVQPCTKRPRWYQISVDERRIRLWDTLGFRLADGGEVHPLSSYKQAYAILRSLPDGINLILLCARKNGIFASLGSLYWLINDFFFGGHAPIAFVITHFDTPDDQWWERNQGSITERTGIPVESLPHACITTVRAGRDQSKQALRALIRTYAAAIPSISSPLDLSSHTTASLDLATNCRLSPPEATALVDEFSRPRNVVLFGKAGVGKSSVINLIAGHPLARVSSDTEFCTLDSTSYVINTPKKQFVIWDTVGFNGVRNGQDNIKQAVVNAVQLIRSMSVESGVDLLVFVKKSGKLTPSELNCYRLFEEFLCEGKVPVAVVITHLEDQKLMEQWWETNGEGLLKALTGNVIGHACITSLANSDPEDSRGTASESKLAVETMLEECVSYLEGEAVYVQLPREEGAETSRGQEKMTVDNLVNGCGLTKELAKEVMKL